MKYGSWDMHLARFRQHMSYETVSASVQMPMRLEKKMKFMFAYLLVHESQSNNNNTIKFLLFALLKIAHFVNECMLTT